MIFRSAQLITVVLLLVAVADLPYDYYTLLRFVVCPVSAFGAYKANAAKKRGWAWALGIYAVLFNPLIRTHLEKETWAILNIVGALLTVGAILALRDKAPAKEQTTET